MFAKLAKPAMLRPAGVFGQLSKAGMQSRFMATVQSNNAQSIARSRATKDRATFTIKVCDN